MEKDVFIKDEGDFFTLGFQSKKAKEVLSNQPENVRMQAHGKELLKIDFANVSENSLIAWCVSHDLSIEKC